jgi:hypothetical protein
MNKRTHAAWRPAAVAAPAFLALIIGLLAAARPTNVGRAQGETLVRCDPAVAAAPVDQPLEVDIYVENVVNMWAGDVQMSFDPTIAQIVDADPAASGVQIQILDDFLSSDFIVRRNGDNVLGTIWYVATQVATQPPEPPRLPVSGSGPLARITFMATQAGSFTMPITYQKIVRSDGTQIEATPLDCQVTFIAVEPDLSIYMPVAFNLP